jgi:hypothetical protein
LWWSRLALGIEAGPEGGSGHWDRWCLGNGVPDIWLRFGGMARTSSFNHQCRHVLELLPAQTSRRAFGARSEALMDSLSSSDCCIEHPQMATDATRTSTTVALGGPRQQHRQNNARRAVCKLWLATTRGKTKTEFKENRHERVV